MLGTKIDHCCRVNLVWLVRLCASTTLQDTWRFWVYTRGHVCHTFSWNFKTWTLQALQPNLHLTYKQARCFLRKYCISYINWCTALWSTMLIPFLHTNLQTTWLYLYVTRFFVTQSLKERNTDTQNSLFRTKFTNLGIKWRWPFCTTG